MVYPLSVWYYAFYLDLGIVGLWLGKISLEYTILVLYIFIINLTDWTLVAENAAKRQVLEKEK